MDSYKIIVIGIVQGVGYRYFTKNKANILGLKGFVKNLPNGSVKIIVQGNKTELEVFFNFLKEGPYHSVVENLIIDHLKDYKTVYSTFKITF